MGAKTRQIAVLELWFAVDKILFGKSVRTAIADNELYENYLAMKGALLSNLYEIYKKIDFVPERKNYKCVKEIIDASSETVNNVLSETKEFMKADDISKTVRDEIKEASHLEGWNEEEIARYIITKRRGAIAIDKITCEVAITKDKKKLLTDWEGKILVDAHKGLRNSLIEIAMQQ